MESRKIGILEELLKESSDVEKLKFCYECSTCTASCPVAWIFPHACMLFLGLHPQRFLVSRQSLRSR